MRKQEGRKRRQLLKNNKDAIKEFDREKRLIKSFIVTKNEKQQEMIDAVNKVYKSRKSSNTSKNSINLTSSTAGIAIQAC